MRIRIALELASHPEAYLDNNFLRAGHPVANDLPKKYAMYSDQYTGERLTATAIRQIYLKEVEDIARPGSYMGIWQVHAIASIFNSKVCSVYPKFGGLTVRGHLHRWVSPRACLASKPVLSSPPASPLGIMWSSTLGRQQRPGNWQMNHFVVLAPPYSVS